MDKRPGLFADKDERTGKSVVRWPALLRFVLVWSAIGMMAFQSYGDRKAVERRSYGHLQDVSNQLLKNVALYFTANRQLKEAVAEAIDFPPASAAQCRLVCEEGLYRVQRRFKGLLPEAELLVLDAQGKPLAGTQRDMGIRLTMLPDLIKQVRDNERTVILVGDDATGTPAFIHGQGYYDQKNQLQAFIVVTEPLSNLLLEVNVSALGQQGVISIVDEDSRILARQPELASIKFGHHVTRLDESRLGMFPGSFVLTSPVDDVERLLVKRELPYGTAKGKLSIYVGAGTEEYLREWRVSAAINAGLSLILLATWIFGITSSRHVGALHRELKGSINTIRRILEEMPLPVLVVDGHSSSIETRNRAAVDLFGSTADSGQPVQKLFADEGAWSQWPNDARKIESEMFSRKGALQFELHRALLSNMDGDPQQRWLLTLVDISETHRHTQQLKREATTDTLTGLANRRYFADCAARMVASCSRHQQPLAVRPGYRPFQARQRRVWPRRRRCRSPGHGQSVQRLFARWRSSRSPGRRGIRRPVAQGQF